MHFVFFGPSSDQARAQVAHALEHVRDTANFNWTFIFFLAVVFYVYWTEIKNKNYDAVVAGLYVSRQEQAGNAFVIRPPEPLNIAGIIRDPKELERVYNIGRKVMTERLDELKEFIKKVKE